MKRKLTQMMSAKIDLIDENCTFLPKQRQGQRIEWLDYYLI
jgi:hypothetical protein